jgi:hypothetical protein
VRVGSSALAPCRLLPVCPNQRTSRDRPARSVVHHKPKTAQELDTFLAEKTANCCKRSLIKDQLRVLLG